LVLVKNKNTRWQHYTAPKGAYAAVGITVLSIYEIALRERCLYNYQPTAEQQGIVFPYAAGAGDISLSAASLPTLDPPSSMGVARSSRWGKTAGS